jgi:hypothetical protein
MREKSCVGPDISIHCPDHPKVSRHQIRSGVELENLFRSEEQFCNIRCGKSMPCKIAEHNCSKTCSPRHTHFKCEVQINERHETCGHQLTRRCWENPKDISCHTLVHFFFPKCLHPGIKKCYVKAEKISCPNPCIKKMDCGKHTCNEKCGKIHDHRTCVVEGTFSFPDCGHTGVKKCIDRVEDQRCSSEFKVALKKCQHEVVKKCFQIEADVVCRHPCGRKNDCNEHECRLSCGKSHSHNVCKEKIFYRFPG